MIQKLNTPSRPTTRALILTFYLAALATQILIVSKIIPYQWVNGGKSESYEAQTVQSVISFIITSVLFLYIWKMTTSEITPKIWQKRVLYAITLLWMLGFIMQLLGTSFERYVMSVVLLTGALGHFQLIRDLAKHR